MTTSISSPALRYHGGKFRLAAWVMQFFPPHQIYVEPFGGAAGVLIQKEPSYAEVYNDLDGEIVNFFRVLRDHELRNQLVEQVALTPYARDEFDLAWNSTDDPVEMARRTAIRAQMGFGSAGATKGTTGFRIDSARKYGTAQHHWARYPDAITAVGKRFEGVLVENRPAIEILNEHDSNETLFYVDPPYVHATRVRPRTGGYRHEMSDADHLDLIACLKAMRGMVVLSGYASDLYSDSLKGWESYSTHSRISAGRGGAIRSEVVWLNPACADSLHRSRGGLFA